MRVLAAVLFFQRQQRFTLNGRRGRLPQIILEHTNAGDGLLFAARSQRSTAQYQRGLRVKSASIAGACLYLLSDHSEAFSRLPLTAFEKRSASRLNTIKLSCPPDANQRAQVEPLRPRISPATPAPHDR